MSDNNGELVVATARVREVAYSERWGSAKLAPLDPMQVLPSRVGGFEIHLTAEEARSLAPGESVELTGANGNTEPETKAS